MTDPKVIKAAIQVTNTLSALGWLLMAIGSYLLGGFPAFCVVFGLGINVLANSTRKAAQKELMAVQAAMAGQATHFMDAVKPGSSQ
jgi:hypothetical protein